MLRRKLEKAWDKKTSYNKSYDGTNPADGQCLVTALVVQAYLGGEIVKGAVKVKGFKKPIQHYWNVMNNVDFDLTWSQFPPGSKVVEYERLKTAARLRFTTGDHPVKKRYLRLKAKVALSK